jgi:hypothetical protein
MKTNELLSLQIPSETSELEAIFKRRRHEASCHFLATDTTPNFEKQGNKV